MAATYVGMNSDLETRVKGLIAESNGSCWLSEGVRSRAEQAVFWAKALIQHPLNPRAWAAFPGTSNHEKGLAADVACNAAYDTKRALLAIKWGLKTPLANEPWHMELASYRGPIPGGQSSAPEARKESDDMPKWADQIIYPNGAKTQVYPDGGIWNHGTTYYGSIPALKDSSRATFDEARSIRPFNLNDEKAGYEIRVATKDGGFSDYGFNAETKGKIDRKEI